MTVPQSRIVADRIVFTLAFGNRRFGEMALGLARSLALIGDTTPRAILTDMDGIEWERYFDIVIRRKVSREETFWMKFAALEHTDAQQVLFIDSDSLAFKRLDPIFDAFAGAPLGVQGILATDGEWYDRPVVDICKIEGIPALPKFNGGMIYYERHPETYELFRVARDIGEHYDETGFRRFSGPHAKGAVPEEPCIGLALARTGLGRVLPERSNFHNSAVGLVGKLHLDVRKNECHYLCRRYDLEYVEPYVFHAHLYSKFLIYWRQLKALERLEK